MEPVYPKTPLEEPKESAGQLHEPEQQQLLHATPAPPSYDQATATATPAETTGPGATAVPAHTVIVVPGNSYGPEPQDIQCPYCHNFARSRILYKPNSRTHLIALLLCLLQLYCCVCLPYCIASCMSANHYCGMCDRYLGTYLRK